MTSSSSIFSFFKQSPSAIFHSFDQNVFSFAFRNPGDQKISSPLAFTLQDHLQKHGLYFGDAGQIKWKNGNRNHPRNWPPAVKAYGTSLVLFLGFFTTTVNTAGVSLSLSPFVNPATVSLKVPASEQAREELALSRPLALFTFTSLYLFAQGFGSVIFSPYSESFGRKKLYVFSAILYATFFILIASFPNLPMLILGRLVTGLCSSIPAAVVPSSIEDLYDATDRVWIIFILTTSTNLGLVVGAIAGSYITFQTGWRWVFWIAGAVMTVASVLLLGIRESRPSQLLEQRVRQIRRATGDNSLEAQNPDRTPDFRTFVYSVFLRPLYLFSEPIVLLVSILNMISFGLVYLFTEAIPIVYSLYGFSPQQSSLAFVPIGLGLLIGILTRIHDNRFLIQRRNLHQPITPEDKLFGFVIATPILALSLWLFAWTTPPLIPRSPWKISFLTLTPVGFAINEFAAVLMGYMADSYTVYAASAFASLTILRSAASATFPLFARRMYESSLGPNGATSLLAGVATVACVCPVVFVRYGRQIRHASTFAQYSLKVHDENLVGSEADEEVAELLSAVHMH